MTSIANSPDGHATRNGTSEPLTPRSLLPPLPSGDTSGIGLLTLPVELQRFARQVARVRPIFEILFYIGSLAVGVASIAAACIGWWAFREYQVQNRVAARTQLLATEHALAQREIDDSLYAQIHVNVPADTPPSQFANRHLALLTADPELRNAPNARVLHELIWSSTSWENKDRTELQALRRLHRHAAANIYHLQTAFDYRGDGVISDGEWQTWAGTISDLGPHPVLLAALYGTHRNGYLSREFAADLRKRSRPTLSTAPSSSISTRKCSVPIGCAASQAIPTCDKRGELQQRRLGANCSSPSSKSMPFSFK